MCRADGVSLVRERGGESEKKISLVCDFPHVKRRGANKNSNRSPLRYVREIFVCFPYFIPALSRIPNVKGKKYSNHFGGQTLV